MRLFMKKLGVSLLCCILVISGCFLFIGCESNELDKYDELKEILFELQANSDDLYEDRIYIEGVRRSQLNGTKYPYTNPFEIELQNLLIFENCIWENTAGTALFYWFYFEITQIQNSNGETIWSKD